MLRQRQARQVLGAMGPQLLVRYQQATTVEHRSTIVVPLELIDVVSVSRRSRSRRMGSLLRGGPNIIFASWRSQLAEGQYTTVTASRAANSPLINFRLLRRSAVS